MKRFPGLKILAILCTSLFASACAVDRPPTGGTPDNTPLAVSASTPERGSINVSPTSIRLEFNHYVTSAAMSRALFFSPVIRDYRITMRGKEAEIRIYSPLKPGRTYTLTLAKSLKSHDGKELASSWTLPFSTGPVIDTGTLDGKVWTRQLAPASNIPVLAYAITPSGAAPPDTLPAAPDYLTQTDGGGNFRFENLAPGSYRLVALRDRNGNHRFDRGKDEFGVTSSPELHTGTKDIAFRLAEGELPTAVIRSARAIDSREIEITLSRSIPVRSMTQASFRITERSTGASLPVLAVFTVNRTEESASFRLLTSPMDPKSTYSVSLASQETPPQGNAPGPTFKGSDRTVAWPGLNVAIVPGDQADNAMPEMVRPDAGPCVELQFNLPVEEASVRKAVTLAASRKTGEQQVPATITRYDSRTWTVRTQAGFEPGTDYMVRVRTALVSSLAGGKAKDSLVVSRFSTAGPDQYGDITVTGATNASELLVEVCRQGTSAAYRTIVHPSANGGYSHAFRNLPPGNYTVAACLAGAGKRLNLESGWEPGSVGPFRPCAPFVAVSASVRPAWTTETVLPSLARQSQEPETAPTGRPKKAKSTRTRH